METTGEQDDLLPSPEPAKQIPGSADRLKSAHAINSPALIEANAAVVISGNYSAFVNP